MSIQRLNLDTQDAIGGTTQVKVTVFKAACRIRLLGAAEMATGGKDGVVSTHRIYCDVLDIHNKDEIIIDKKIYDVNTTNNIENSLQADVTLRV